MRINSTSRKSSRDTWLLSGALAHRKALIGVLRRAMYASVPDQNSELMQVSSYCKPFHAHQSSKRIVISVSFFPLERERHNFLR